MNREGLLLAYYGDDFTGSADVMEALACSGLRTVLFLRPPNRGQLSGFPGLRAFGIAGGSRTLSPEGMERELPPAFEALQASGAPIVHYKMCSTFDSSPSVGSIGKAIELGRTIFGSHTTPLAVGLPVLGRYVVFGNLFAKSGLDSDPVRLDRHPTMCRHPVTPMTESDLRRVLGEQTRLRVELLDVLHMDALVTDGMKGKPSASPRLSDAPILLFDTVRDEHLLVIGRELAKLSAATKPLFIVGSSAVEYALTAGWMESGLLPPRRIEDPHPTESSPVSETLPPLVCVSGSCSPVTDRQIAAAVEAGFAEMGLDACQLLEGHKLPDGLGDAVSMLRSGRSVVLHTSRGPADSRLQLQWNAEERERLGMALGRCLDRILSDSGLGRAVVCGGDTSMAVARALGVEAVEFVAKAAPGSPLCRVHAPGRAADGCEMVFKGGQNGRDRFLLDVLRIPRRNGSVASPEFSML